MCLPRSDTSVLFLFHQQVQSIGYAWLQETGKYKILVAQEKEG